MQNIMEKYNANAELLKTNKIYVNGIFFEKKKIVYK